MHELHGVFLAHAVNGDPEGDDVLAVYGVVALVVVPRGLFGSPRFLDQDVFVVEDTGINLEKMLYDRSTFYKYECY